MKSIFRISVFCFAVAVGLAPAPPAFAADTPLPSVDEIIDKAISDTKEMDSYSSDITMKMALQGMNMEYKGTIKAKGERFRIDMVMPIMGQQITTKSIMGADGIMYSETSGGGMNQVTRYDREKVQALMKDLYGEDFMGSMGNLDKDTNDPRQMLQNIKNQFDLEVTGTDTIDGVEVYVLRGGMKEEFANKMDPTNQLSGMGFNMNNVEYMIGKEDGFPRAFGYPNQDGVYSMQMLYSNVNFAPDLEDSLFEYSPPEGVEVVDMTEMMAQQLKALQDGTLGQPMEEVPTETAAVVGEPAIAFEGPAYEGGTLKLADYKGKVVLLDFWATWCAPCVMEMPNVIKTYNQFHDKGLEIIGISLDDSPDALKAFLAERPDMTWKHVYDGKGWDSAVVNLYEVVSIPTTILIDKEGIVRHVGLRGQELATAIESLLQ